MGVARSLGLRLLPFLLPLVLLLYSFYYLCSSSTLLISFTLLCPLFDFVVIILSLLLLSKLCFLSLICYKYYIFCCKSVRDTRQIEVSGVTLNHVWHQTNEMSGVTPINVKKFKYLKINLIWINMMLLNLFSLRYLFVSFLWWLALLLLW